MNITQSVVSERDRALLGGDYNVYHRRTVRRIHALRRRLGDATPRGRKFVAKSAVTSENVGQNAEWVQLLLASAERAWAHAMTMKTSQSPENTQKPMQASTRKQILSRYTRSIQYAMNLVEVTQDQAISKCTSTDFLEAKAYLALLRGGLEFEKRKWQSCISNYAIARLIYSALENTSRLEIFKELLSTTVDPTMRYAAYQMKLPRTKLVSDIAIEQFPPSEKGTKSDLEKLQPDVFTSSSEKSATRSDQPSNLPSLITWRTRKVKVEDATVSQALGISQERENTIESRFKAYTNQEIASKELAGLFDDVIDARQDAVDATKNAIDELKGEGVEQGDSRIQSLQVTRTAINYALIEWRIGRNRVLCGSDDGLLFEPEPAKQISKLRKDGKPRTAKDESTGKKLSRLRERVALYDLILQSIESVKELPGVIADSDFVQELDGKKSYFQALKCINIGRSHSLDGSVINALSLYFRASKLATTAAKQIKPVDTVESSPLKKFDIGSSQLKALRSFAHSLVSQYRALAELKSVSSDNPIKDKAQSAPLVEKFHFRRYDDHIDLTNLVNYPPKLQPVPVKPLFFDLAWNYIQYPGKVQKTNGNIAPKSVVEPAAEPQPAKRGWFGFGR